MTLISTCAISGTFAKYVTRASGEDQARVAKWGVVVTIEGNAFGTKYKTHETGDKAYPGEFSVIAENEDQVVAPGTSSKDLESNLVATVSGKPEVAARYSIEGSNITDVVLPAGKYTDYTQLVKDEETGTYGYTEKFELPAAYAPIKWDIAISKNGGEPVLLSKLLYDNLPEANRVQAEAYGLTPNGCSFFDAIAIIQKVAGSEAYQNIVEAALGQVVSGGSNFQLEADKDAGTFKLSYDFDPNKEMNFKFELTWSWAFEMRDDEGNVVDLIDQADTFLGNWAAVEMGQEIEGFVTPEKPASIRISATLTATAVQID
jgi:hypothetical protein